ncbi:DUF4129 domain-containing protein [Gramella sp. AN32]|uniref:DUF4129 domain-containing protein n=1 Tax=Christiangramia antarctica TaxID=2058158 RepID=A0ABW5X828_9FLAO|nr:DUF4129 domain-containing protein [Gramella sp. AN32]MCM4156586.1 DUF4129 domain-containing protein [Gramella sp. AN32]
MKQLVLYFFLFISGVGISQNTDSIAEPKKLIFDKTENLAPAEFSEEKIKEYLQDGELVYKEVEVKDNWWTRFKRWVNMQWNRFQSWLFGDYEPIAFVKFLIAVLPYLLIFLLLVFIIWLFNKLNPGSKILNQQKRSEVFISKEEELVKHEDLPNLIKQAIENGQFREAVRYYYLNELRKLDRLKLIDYQFQKTNRDYAGEILKPELKKQFIEITRWYEYIWYGSFEVTEKDFQIALKGFEKMDQNLSNL